MRRPVLPVMVVLTVIAGAVGLQLGESAIAQIDPLYFSGPAPLVRDVSKGTQADPVPAYAESIGWSETNALVVEECDNCTLAEAEMAPVPAARPAVAREPEIAPEEGELVTEELPLEPEGGSRHVRRYLDYPVSADQAQIRAALNGEKPSAEPAD